MREIVICGEALVDVVQTGSAGVSASSGTAESSDGTTDYRRNPSGRPLPPLQPALGGGPFNVAITLGRLGSAVSLLSAVSADAYGEAIVAALDAAGVGTSLIQRRAEPTSLALATVGADGAAQYTFYVHGTADRTVRDPGPLPPTVAAVGFGTLSLVLEPGASVYEALLQRSHREGRLVVLDPNIRTAVIDDPDAYRRRFRSWTPSVDVVKVSDEDAAWLADGPDGSGPDDWLRAGVAAIVTTAGADGITVTTSAGAVTAPAPRVEVADTIGAGDSTLGGVLHALDGMGALSPAAVRGLDADSWRSVAEHAAHVAAVTVSRPGADPPWASELRSD